MEVLGFINRGGFGRVEQVRLPDGKVVARKVFDPSPNVVQATDIEKLKKRFSREVRVQSTLKSDSFIPILDFDLKTSEPWFTMPLAERNYSEQIIEDRETGDVTKQALTDILNALEELHLLGYVHRDLKPQNVLLHDGKWKLSDFGLVLPSITETEKLTATDSAWGTALYCAPEQIQDFKSVTSSADIYSFGCILHDIFGNKEYRIPYQQYSCSGQIGLVIEKCTEVSIKKRFKNISSLRGMLLAILSQPSGLSPNPKAEEWENSLKQINSWDSIKLEEFARYLSKSANTADLWVIFKVLDEEKLEILQRLDNELWATIALVYCKWAHSSFGFDYCDVVIGRLETIFALGEIECKAAAVLAAADLGASHNRWYVMRRLLNLCGHQLESSIARRIAIEIVVEEAQRWFRNSVTEIKKELDDYHPEIATVLAFPKI